MRTVLCVAAWWTNAFVVRDENTHVWMLFVGCGSLLGCCGRRSA